jgi:hypothetical protein
VFWSAVLIDILALGVAWSAWKSPGTSVAGVFVAVAASTAVAVATMVAARIIVVTSGRDRDRATRKCTP